MQDPKYLLSALSIKLTVEPSWPPMTCEKARAYFAIILGRTSIWAVDERCKEMGAVTF